MRALLAIKSCWPNSERRKACRETWLPALDWADYKFFVGRHKPLKYFADPCDSLYGESDVVSFPLDDGFKNIAPKIKAIMNYAITRQYGRVVVLDDDTYLRPERLKQFLDEFDPEAQPDYVGWVREGVQHYIQGACYIVSNHAMHILASNTTLRDGIADDVAVGRIMDEKFCVWQHCDRFWPGAEPRLITMSNNLISTHKAAIAHNRDNVSMKMIHEAWEASCRRYSTSAPTL